ncbi:hypothetical protein ACFL0Z_00680 [Patescibacteria group bacterium]
MKKTMKVEEVDWLSIFWFPVVVILIVFAVRLPSLWSNAEEPKIMTTVEWEQGQYIQRSTSGVLTCSTDESGEFRTEVRTWTFEEYEILTKVYWGLDTRGRAYQYWERYVICPNGQRRSWAFGGSHDGLFHQRCMITGVELQEGDTKGKAFFYYTSSGGPFLRTLNACAESDQVTKRPSDQL